MEEVKVISSESGSESVVGEGVLQHCEQVRKRDGRIVDFDKTKIADAIFKAAQAVGGEDRMLADELAEAVTLYLRKKFGVQIPSIEEIQDIVEKVLIETGHAKTAKAYILYREKRAKVREKLRVRKKQISKADTTDFSLLVTPFAKDEISGWQKAKIIHALMKEAGLEPALADEIASSVEQKIFESGISQISTTLIRELVDNELFERGLDAKLSRQTIIGMPTYDLEQIIYSKSCENSNINSNNPEAINLAIAENILKQYMLRNVFTEDVANAHLKGVVHIHDLGYPRVYCSSHSLEYLKKYGLELDNLDTSSAPASHARTLTGHLNTFLASLQAYYAGALGIGYINIFYAPYLEGMTYKEMKQEAQYLIFSGSQNAFSRGGQSLFIDFNIHTGIPRYLKNIPAIGRAGGYTGKTYGEYEETARTFAKAMLNVWQEGDCYGHPFAFPKCLDGDTKIFARINSKLGITTVKEAALLKTSNPFVNIQLPNFDFANRKLEWTNVTASAHRGGEIGIGLKLANNIEVKTTSDHIHFILTKDGIEKKRADQLMVGDVLLYKENITSIFNNAQYITIDMIKAFKEKEVIAQVQNAAGNDTQNSYAARNQWCYINTVDENSLTENSYITTVKQKTHKLPVKVSIDERWAKLLGYFVSEGSYQNSAAMLNQCSSSSCYEDIRNLLDSMNISYRSSINHSRIVGIIFGGKLLKNLLQYLIPGYLNDAAFKEVPWVIFNSPRTVKEAFLQGLFNGDGTVKGTTISYNTKSEKLAYGVQILLSGIGIYSTIYKEKRSSYPQNSYYNLAVKGKGNLDKIFAILKNDKFCGLPSAAYKGDMIDISWPSHIPVSLLEKENLKSGENWKLGRHNYLCRQGLKTLPEELLLEEIIPVMIRQTDRVYVDSYALEVDNEQHSFIIADGIVTHNCDLHINRESFDDPKQYELLKYACEIASINGAPYFVFDRDEVTLSACCRLRTQIRDNYMIEHPESMRFCGFQNVTINLPQAAYRAGRGNIEGLYREIEYAMDIAVKAHLQKKAFIQELMKEEGMPMWEVGKIAKDGRPYIDLNAATYIIGIIGLNECVQFLTGKELHESDEAYKLGLNVISYMFLKARKEQEKHGLKFSLEESPAESATRRLSKVDLVHYPEYAHIVVKGNIEKDQSYYTNSVHFRADAPLDFTTRIMKQSKFHTMIESGAIIHAFVGETRPSSESILNLVSKTYKHTQAAQLTISPEFTICNTCHKMQAGLKENCVHCGEQDVYGVTRIVGYYSRVNNWNKSKLGELEDRQKGHYAVA